MRTQRLVSLVLSLMLALAGLAGAQQAGAPSANEEAAQPSPDEKILVTTGKAFQALSDARPGEFVLDTKDGRMTFVINADSEVPQSIGAGEIVTVWYVKWEGKLFATSIRMGNHLNPDD